MAIYQSTAFNVIFTIKQNSTAVDITGWTFEADFRTSADSSTTLLTLTTANTGFTITSAGSGLVRMTLTAVQTAMLPVGKVVFDVMRTDISPGPERLFGASTKVKLPVTR